MPLFDPTMSVTQVLQFRALGVSQGQQFVFTANYRLANNPVTPQSTNGLSGLMLGVRTLFRQNYLANASSQLSIQTYEGRLLVGRSPIGPPAPVPPRAIWQIQVAAFQQVSGNTITDVGVVNGETLPAQAAVVIGLRTGHGGKGGNGNVRAGPVLELQQANGLLTDGGFASWTGAAQFWLLPAAAAGNPPDNLQPVIFPRYSYTHKTTGGATLTPVAASLDIGAITVNRAVRSQNSRRPPLRVGS